MYFCFFLLIFFYEPCYEMVHVFLDLSLFWAAMLVYVSHDCCITVFFYRQMLVFEVESGNLSLCYSLPITKWLIIQIIFSWLWCFHFSYFCVDRHVVHTKIIFAFWKMLVLCTLNQPQSFHSFLGNWIWRLYVKFYKTIKYQLKPH